MVNKITTLSYLEPLLKTKEYLHLADISRQLKEPHVTVRKYLNFFEKKGLLIKQKKGRLTLYKINFENPNLIDYLIIAEKEKLIDKCEKDLKLKEIVLFLHSNLNKSVLIFGSAAEESKKSNDIDLLVIGKTKIENKIKDIERRLNIKIHLINVDNFKEINESLKEEVRKKHLIVNNSEEIIKWMI